MAIIKKQNQVWSGIHDEVVDRISDLTIDCPECESIIYDDPQYCCTTCNRTDGRINVLIWINEQLKNKSDE